MENKKPSSKCKIHGYTEDVINAGRGYFKCKKCRDEKSKIYNEYYKHNTKQYVRNYTRKKSLPCTTFQCGSKTVATCSKCIRKWKKIQIQYLTAFKPQRYQFRWNQI